MPNLPLPDTYERLITQVTEQFPEMKKVSSESLDSWFRTQMPWQSNRQSDRRSAGVQPSSLVRFGSTGLQTFSEMKRVFQSHLISTASSKERLESFSYEVSQPPAIHQQLF